MKILDRLIQDHDLLRDLLMLFGHELAAFEQGEHADLQLMQDIARHYSEYFNRVHHTLEDALYEFLLAQGMPAGQGADQALVQHAELVSATGRLLAHLGDALNGVIMPRSQLVSAGQRFVDLNLAHMAHEERTVFVWAREIVRENAWKEPIVEGLVPVDYLLAYTELLRHQLGNSAWMH